MATPMLDFNEIYIIYAGSSLYKYLKFGTFRYKRLQLCKIPPPNILEPPVTAITGLIWKRLVQKWYEHVCVWRLAVICLHMAAGDEQFTLLPFIGRFWCSFKRFEGWNSIFSSVQIMELGHKLAPQMSLN